MHAGAGIGLRGQAIAADQAGVHSKHQRGVGEAGMGADFLFAIALALEQLSEFRLAGAVVFLDGVHADGCCGPLAIEPIGDGLLVLLVAAVIAEEDDVAEPGEPEAARRVFEQLSRRSLPVR